MKINLVVASGVHQGKAIPVPGGKLSIGRDPSCQLRPASPAVSKLHCTIAVRDGRVYVTDHNSTNGTVVNDEPITGEVEVQLGDRVRVGPLDFTIQPAPGSKTDATPLPETLKSVDKEAPKSSVAGIKPVPPAKPGTPLPMPKPPAPQPAAEAPKPAPPKPKPKPAASGSADDMAAMLLAEDDDDPAPPAVPEGSTVMELPAVDAEKLKQAGPAAGADKKKPAAPSAQETSSAANEILKKYMRRPK